MIHAIFLGGGGVQITERFRVVRSAPKLKGPFRWRENEREWRGVE